jgi:AhpD family alkylhydroperoxidase
MRVEEASVHLTRDRPDDNMPTFNRPHRSMPMALVKLTNYKDAAPEAQAVFDDIMATRNTDYVNHIWRALAAHPPLLKRFWTQMKEIMVKPSRLDPMTKELIYLAVSITNDCTYCINTHTAAARKKGMDNEILGELNEIVALANAGNRLTSGLQVEVDAAVAQKHKYTEWKAPRRVASKKPASKKAESKAGSKKAVKKPVSRKTNTGKVAAKPATRRKSGK